MGPAAFPRSVFIESNRIEACMDFAKNNHAGRIAVSSSTGFHLSNLSFLSRYPWVEHLTLMESEAFDISEVNSLQNLRFLQISGRTKQRFDLTAFPCIEEFRAQWWPNLRFGNVLNTLRILSLSRYAPKSSDLKALPEIPGLEDLDLVEGRNLGLSGIEQFHNLKRLTVAYFPNLSDLSALLTFSDSALEILEFKNCPKIVNHEVVQKIGSLRRLAFNECGQITSLKFLNELVNLQSFSFVGTNIVDGDLSPCLRLKFVGFMDRRHYSHRRSDFPAVGELWKPTIDVA